MSCGGRVYKGDTVTISVPFEVDDYSNLTITYSTIGNEKIVLTEDEVEIEDGFITHTFQGHDLDLLPDGVIYYTISCDVLGVPNVDSTNTNLYLKTPAGYSGRTAEDIYQEGYEDGLNDCSGGTPCDCSSAYTQGYHEGEVIGKVEGYTSGYTDGYNQGQQECSGGSCDLQTLNVILTASTQTIVAPKGIRPTPPSGVSVVYGGDYEQFYNLVSGNTDSELLIRMWNNDHTANFVVGRFCFIDGSFAFRTLYDTTYIDDIPDEWTLINLPAYGSIWFYNDRSNFYFAMSLVNDWFFDGHEKEDLILPTKSIDGYDVIHISGSSCPESIEEAYQSGYTEGYNQGQADCPECPTNIQGTANRTMTQQGETFYPDEGYDGMGSVYVDGSGLYQSAYTEGYQAGLEDCSGSTPCDCSSAVTESYQSGYTDGYNQGIQACQDLWGGIWCADENWDGQEITLTPADFASTGAGFSSITISDCGYGQSKYNEGFADGQASCPECDCSSAITEAYQSGYTAGFDDAGTCDCTQSNAIAYNSGFTNGYDSGYTDGFNYGFSSGRTVGRREGYYQGEQSVIHSFLAGNDIGVNGGYYQYGTLVAYYYTPNGQPCVITGYNDDCNIRWDDVFQSMSVDGGPLQRPQLYYYFTAGWHQIRFTIKHRYLEYAFSHNFQPTQVEVNGNMVYPYMDALKAVSLPGPTEYGESGVTAFIGTFYMNNGIRILSSSIGSSDIGNANIISGATNLNIIISHYEGNENVEITSDVQNGILFYPQGKASTHSSTLTGWTHMELF